MLRTITRQLPPSSYRIPHRTMSSAFIVPYDLKTSVQLAPGVDVAELWNSTPQGDKPPKVGTTRTFYNTPQAKVTTVSSLGSGFAEKSADVKRELVRKSVGSGVKVLKVLEGVKDVTVDESADPHASGQFTLHLHDHFADRLIQLSPHIWLCTASPSRPLRHPDSTPTSRNPSPRSLASRLFRPPRNGIEALFLARLRTSLVRCVFIKRHNTQLTHMLLQLTELPANIITPTVRISSCGVT
jgi:hypothetical protein